MENEPTTLDAALDENRRLRSENAALRTEVAELRAENAELKAKLTEVSAELLRIKEILGLNSQNSSKPPSSDMKKPLKKLGGLGRPRGGQKGHQGTHRELWPEELLTEQIECPPVKQCPCGGRVELQSGVARRQVFELPEIQPEVREYKILSGVCCTCGKNHQGPLPVGVPKGIVGPRLMAWMSFLASYFHLSKVKIQLLVFELMGVHLSTGTISSQEDLVSGALEPIYAEAHTHIKTAAYLHVDETGFRQGNADGNNPKATKAWIWTAVSTHVTLFLIQLGRGKTQAQRLMGEAFLGTVCSDRWGAYAWVPIYRRSLCWAHLLRDFQRMAERDNALTPIAEHLIGATRDVFEWHQAWKQDELTDAEYHGRVRLIRADVEIQLNAATAFTNDSDKLLAQSAAFCQRLLKDQVALWTHTYSKEIEPSNNKAERALRQLVVWRKVCYGTQSLRGSEFLQRIFTVIASCQQQQRGILHFLTQAVKAHFMSDSPPSLVPELNHAVT